MRASLPVLTGNEAPDMKTPDDLRTVDEMRDIMAVEPLELAASAREQFVRVVADGLSRSQESKKRSRPESTQRERSALRWRFPVPRFAAAGQRRPPPNRRRNRRDHRRAVVVVVAARLNPPRNRRNHRRAVVAVVAARLNRRRNQRDHRRAAEVAVADRRRRGRPPGDQRLGPAQSRASAMPADH
jgi:hypothetical protein